MEKNRILFLMTALILLLSYSGLNAQITSAQSGAWSAGATWVGGAVPGSANDVVIAAGHVITIDDSLAACKSITFGDTASHLQMTAAASVFKVYGDFTLNALTHKVFNAWAAGAKIKFSGSALKQTLAGWNTASGTSTTLQEIVIDKDTGIVTTNRSNERFSFGTSLDIVRGTFVLDSTDDMESRTVGGSGTDGVITVYPKGTFTMVGGASHIRRGTFTDTVNARIGKMTIHGKATFTTTSTNKINFKGIDIEDGGQLTLTTGGTSAKMNSSTITVKNGGVLYNATTISLYDTTAYIVLEPGGEFNAATSTTPLPMNGINYSNGTVRFSRSSDQTLPALMTTFNNLYLSGGGIKTLGGNITVNGTLSFRGTAVLSLGASTLVYGPSAVLQYGASGQTSAQTTSDAEFPAAGGPKNLSIYNTGGVTLHANRTIEGTLTLSSGTFDNNGSADDKVLTIADGALIRRASGSLSVAPAFAGKVNLAYISTVSSVTTGAEVPVSAAAVKNVTIASTKGVELGADLTVNDTLIFDGTSSLLTTNAKTLTLASAAYVRGEGAGKYVLGNLSATRQVGTSANDFGGIGFSLNAGADNLGTVTVVRKTGPSAVVTSSGKSSIARNWLVTPASQPASGRSITFNWPSSDDNGIVFSNTTYARVKRLDGSNWVFAGPSANVSGSDPRSITTNSNSLTQLSVFDTLGPNGINNEKNIIPNVLTIRQNYPNPFNPSTVINFSMPNEGKASLKIYDVMGSEMTTLVDNMLSAGSHQAVFNAANRASGIYYAVLKVDGKQLTIKMLMIK